MLLAPHAAFAETPAEWRFDVLLDGSPIGSQVFRLTRDGDRSRVEIDASFDVKVLFFTAYSYRHRNEEVWEGDCLRSMQASTDDNGKLFRVNATSTANGVLVETIDGREQLPACISSFAYWAPGQLRSRRLLNSQTGKYETVTLRELGQETIAFRGQPTPARRIALEGDNPRIDLWYSATDDWLALEAMTTSGRKLSYLRQ
jgi:hypothetical protein